MRTRLEALSRLAVLNLLSLSLIFGIVAYRTDFISAQETAEDENAAVALPQETPIAKDEDEDDDADDPPTDNDGVDTPPADADEASDSEAAVYTVKPGDTLLRIARRLGVPFASLAAQTDNPSLIHAGQQFTYDAGDSGQGASGQANASSAAPPVAARGVQADGGELQTFVFTVRKGDTLSHIAAYLGVPLEALAAQADNPRVIKPGQQFSYQSQDRIDTPPLWTDNDGTDSDGVDTTGQGYYNAGNQQGYSDNDGYDTTGNLTDNDGTDSDGYDTTGNLTDNDGTDSDGVDTTGNLTDNDGTDSDGYDTTGNLTDNDGTDSDGYDTTGNLSDNDSPDTPDSADS